MSSGRVNMRAYRAAVVSFTVAVVGGIAAAVGYWVGETEIWLTLATRDEEHCETLLAAMRGWGYEVERVS